VIDDFANDASGLQRVQR